MCVLFYFECVCCFVGLFLCLIFQFFCFVCTCSSCVMWFAFLCIGVWCFRLVVRDVFLYYIYIVFFKKRFSCFCFFLVVYIMCVLCILFVVCVSFLAVYKFPLTKSVFLSVRGLFSCVCVVFPCCVCVSVLISILYIH